MIYIHAKHGKKSIRELRMVDIDEFEEALNEISLLMQESSAQYEKESNSWWEQLSDSEREYAFYSVVKRVHKAEVIDQGSYRHALYNVFGFDMSMYGVGMDAGYLSLHNLIFQGLEYEKMLDVSRLEVIDDKGRSYSKMFGDKSCITDFSLQDDDQTLKIFIEPKGEN